MDNLNLYDTNEYLPALGNKLGNRSCVPKSVELLEYLRGKIVNGYLALPHSDLLLMSEDCDLHDQVCAHINYLSKQ